MSRPRNRELPTFGRWARLVLEYALFTFGALWLVQLVVSAFQESTGSRGPVGQMAGYVALLCILLAFAAGIVWIVAEMMAGYRARRT